MRILVIVPNLNELGGVATYYHSIEGRFQNDVDYLQVGSWQGISTKSFFVQVVQAVKDVFSLFMKVRHYDLVHFNPSFGAKCFFREMIFVWVAKCFRRKVVIFVRGWNVDFAKLVDSRFRWLFKIGYCKVDAFIVLASEFRQAFESWGYKGPVYLETTTVDEKNVRVSPVENKGHSSLNLLYMARIERAKGVYDCVDALKYLPDGSYELTIAGNGNEREAVVDYLTENNIKGVDLCGWVSGSEKIEAYSRADIFLFPSRHGEGMPTSVLEAMAYGLPVVTSNAGGVKDFFENGLMGYLIDPVTPVRLAEGIIKLQADPELRRKISKFNQQYAKKHFYSGRVVKRLERIYAEVHENRCRPDWHRRML